MKQPAPDDFLEEIIQEEAKRTPEFPQMVEDAYRSRLLLRELAAARKSAHLSRTAVAARMQTSESAVARLESGTCNPRLSTIERFAAAVGMEVDWQLKTPDGS